MSEPTADEQPGKMWITVFPTRRLDETRTWITVTDSQGHQLTVEDHPGGSRAHCDQCGEWVDYGGYNHDPVQEAIEAAKVVEARALVADADAADPPVPDVAVAASEQATSGDTPT